MVQYSIERVLQALADPSRREMFERLAKGAAPAGVLAAPVAMSLPAVLKHLKVLEAAGLVTTRKVGRTRTCAVVPESLAVLSDWIQQQRTNWERGLDDLESYLTASAQNTEDKETRS